MPGYGITAKEYNYDDYAGIDVKDKLVLILRHEPQENDEKSVFDGKKLTEHATFIDKMVNAKMHGARGVILINDVAAHPSPEDKLEKFGANGGPRDAGIFFVQIKAATAEGWLRAEGRDLRQIEKDIDSDLKPRSFRAGRRWSGFVGGSDSRDQDGSQRRGVFAGEDLGVRDHRRALRSSGLGR